MRKLFIALVCCLTFNTVFGQVEFGPWSSADSVAIFNFHNKLPDYDLAIYSLSILDNQDLLSSLTGWRATIVRRKFLKDFKKEHYPKLKEFANLIPAYSIGAPYPTEDPRYHLAQMKHNTSEFLRLIEIFDSYNTSKTSSGYSGPFIDAIAGSLSNYFDIIKYRQSFQKSL